MSAPGARPRVLIVGGPDVDQRLDLMRSLRPEFDLAAAGTAEEVRVRFESEGFPFFRYSMGRGVSPSSDLRALVALVGICRRFRPDVVHAFATKPAVWGRVAARIGDVPVVIGTLPGLGSLYVEGGARKRAVRAVYRRLQQLASHASTLTIFQNAHDEAELLASGTVPAGRTAVIAGSGVRTDVFDPGRIDRDARTRSRQALGFVDGQVVVTMVSRVIRSKGVLDFAEAAAAVRDRVPHARFLLVGPPDPGSVDRLDDEEMARLSSRVSWVGRRDDIVEVLGASDIFVLPSRYREGVPRVLLEAGSMGLPLIAADSPGCADAVSDGENGFLVPPGQPAALGERIVRLAADEALRHRFGRASRRRTVRLFDIGETARQTARTYRRLLNGPRGGRATAASDAVATRVPETLGVASADHAVPPW